MPSFSLTRAGPEDMLEMVKTAFRTFKDPVSRNLYMGPDTLEQHQFLADRWIARLKQHPEECWIKVIDDTKGNIIAGSRWDIYANDLPDIENKEDRSLPWLDDQPDKLKEMHELHDLHATTRRALWKKALIQLEVCFTDPAYARQGAGALMVKWGCDLADVMMLPIWVEASVAGGKLYERFGFEHVTNKGMDMPGDIKKREPGRIEVKDVRLPKDAVAVEVPKLTATA